MTTRRGRAPRTRPSRVVLRVLAFLVVFALGTAFGQALRDNPEPGRTRTSIRTLQPLPLPPARETVTVTVPAP